MKQYEIEISGQAEQDLRGIFEYIAFDLQAPENAAGQLKRLEESILSLAEMPQRYREYDREPWKSRGLHVLPIDNFIIYYIPDEKSSVVSVIRVMYGGRDTDKQLREFTKF